MPDGGWVATHEDITEFKSERNSAHERISLQALIDWMPDSLWVKDAKSRFIIVNKITAAENNIARPADIIGKTDFDLFPPELAQHFFEIEQKIIQSGETMIDMMKASLMRRGPRNGVRQRRCRFVTSRTRSLA